MHVVIAIGQGFTRGLSLVSGSGAGGTGPTGSMASSQRVPKLYSGARKLACRNKRSYAQAVCGTWGTLRKVSASLQLMNDLLLGFQNARTRT